MIKNKIDYKLVNLALITLILFLLYHTGNLWIGMINKFGAIIMPFIISFAIAYALHPFLKFLMKHKIPKTISIMIILAVIFGTIGILIVLVGPLLFEQTISLVGNLITFVKEISVSVDLGSFQTNITEYFNDIIKMAGSYATNGILNVINVSISYIAIAFIIFSATIYFLIDMDHIRAGVSQYLKRKSEKVYSYVALLDKEMKSYLTGLLSIMFITLFEYTLAYKLIGHQDALLLGILAMLGGLIPYFGGMITNIVAAVTAFVISPALFIRTVITFVILSEVDGYLINPLVYGKTNNVHPIIVIISVFAGGKLFGILGIMFSFPLAVFIITTIKYFKVDINRKIGDIKGKK